MNAPPLTSDLPTLDLAPALVVLPGPRAAVASGAAEGVLLRPPQARDLLEAGPVMVAHAGMTARRLGQNTPPRSPRIFDVLELFAFVRPAQFCAPSAAGLALALGQSEPKGVSELARSVVRSADLLLKEVAAWSQNARAEALAQAETMGRAGWPWAAPLIG
ncbi:MAG TPA: ATP-dependent DNA helicase, partial [Caulobacteraceae bacterium]